MDDVRIPVAEGVALRVLRRPGSGAGGPAPFLLVHGLASNARMWDGVAQRLAEAGHDVAAVDLRGHGLSDKPDEGYDFASVVSDLVALIEGLGLARPVVAGQSWGGNVVVELAASARAELRGIVCVDGGWLTFDHFDSWEEMRDRLEPPRLAGTPRAEIERHVRSAHPDWPESGIQGALACFRVREDDTVEPWLSRDRHLAIVRAMWEQDLRRVLPRVSVPALLVPCDDGSPWVGHKRAEVERAAALLPRARVHWFAAEHDVHAQRPEAVAGLLLDAVREGFFA